MASTPPAFPGRATGRNRRNTGGRPHAAEGAEVQSFIWRLRRSPTLLKRFCDRHFVQVVFDPTLQSAPSAKGILGAGRKIAVAELLTRAKRERPRIIAFSHFDKNQSLDKIGVDLSCLCGCAHHCLIQALSKSCQGLGEPQSQGACILAPRINPPHAAKTL